MELDYLGFIDVESKYLQVSTIQWLIAQVKLIETHKRIKSVILEVNVRKNSLSVCKKENSTSINNSEANDEEKLLINNTLSDIFKLTSLTSDPLCFGYFYRKTTASFNLYTLHAFTSNKSNLAQVLYDFQMQALRIHENLHYEKIFDFKMVTKVKLATTK